MVELAKKSSPPERMRIDGKCEKIGRGDKRTKGHSNLFRIEGERVMKASCRSVFEPI